MSPLTRCLTRLEVTNFRAFEYQPIELAPITIFVGPNNSGKSSRIKLGKIKYVRTNLHFHIKKKLRIDCGFPQGSDRYEMTYIEVANATKEKYIVTEDIHFYEPSQKKADEATKCKIKKHRNGSVCKFLASLGIKIGTIEHALSEIEHSLPGAPP